MYWRKRGEVFVRPVRWLVAMLDEQVVPMELFGIAAGQDVPGTPHHRKRNCRHSSTERIRRNAARRKGFWEQSNASR